MEGAVVARSIARVEVDPEQGAPLGGSDDQPLAVGGDGVFAAIGGGRSGLREGEVSLAAGGVATQVSEEAPQAVVLEPRVLRRGAELRPVEPVAMQVVLLARVVAHQLQPLVGPVLNKPQEHERPLPDALEKWVLVGEEGC